MGFWNILKEKLTGKKTEQINTVLPTLQDIDKGNSELNQLETKTVESIINAPIETPKEFSQDNIMPSMGPSPEGLPLAAAEKATAATPLKKKVVRKKVVKKAAPKKRAPTKKVAKKVVVKRVVKKASPRKKVVAKPAPKKKAAPKKRAPANKVQKKSSKKKRR